MKLYVSHQFLVLLRLLQERQVTDKNREFRMTIGNHRTKGFSHRQQHQSRLHRQKKWMRDIAMKWEEKRQQNRMREKKEIYITNNKMRKETANLNKLEKSSSLSCLECSLHSAAFYQMRMMQGRLTKFNLKCLEGPIYSDRGALYNLLKYNWSVIKSIRELPLTMNVQHNAKKRSWKCEGEEWEEWEKNKKVLFLLLLW